MEKLEFSAGNGTVEKYYVEAETRLNGFNYLLVSDSCSDEANALILKEISREADEEKETLFVTVDDETELEILLNVFREIMDGAEITM